MDLFLCFYAFIYEYPGGGYVDGSFNGVPVVTLLNEAILSGNETGF